MKKLISGVLVLLTVAAAAFFFFKMRRYLPERPRATELAPAETLFFAQIPNLRETAFRFRKTDLFAIWLEPEMQAFLEKPREKAPQMRQWEAQFAQLVRVAPGEAFVAVTSIDGPQPRFVAGFSFAGSRAEVEALLAEPRAAFKRQWPVGKSDVVSYKAAAIETFGYPQGELAECFVRNWYFLANDLPLLRATLDRYEAPAGATDGTLAGNEVFQKAIAPLGSGLDALLFGQFTKLTERLGTLMAAAPGPKAVEKQDAENAKPQAFSAGTKIDGTKMRDTIFFLDPGVVKEEPLSRSTLALCGPQSFLYYATGIGWLLELPESVGTAAALLPGIAAIEQALTEQGLNWSDFGQAFGPEMGTALEWPAEAAMPAVLLAFEVRDPIKARRFLDVLAVSRPGSPGWTRREEGGVVHFAAPVEGVTLFSPALALTDRFAVLGFSADSIANGLERAQTAGAGLAESPAYLQAVKLAAPATSGFGYLALGGLFERAYLTLRPVITMSLAFSEDAGNYVDAGRLPSASAIAKHLSPSVFSQSVQENGTLIESTGTLTFNQALIGTLGGTIAAALPAIQGAVTAGLKPEATLVDPVPMASSTPSDPIPSGAKAISPSAPVGELTAPAPALPNP